MELVQIQVLTRHGARTPVTNIPNINDFPNVEETVWTKDTFEVQTPRINISIKCKMGEMPKVSVYDKEMLDRGLLKVCCYCYFY